MGLDWGRGGASVWVLIGVGLLSRASRKHYRRAERRLMTRNHPGVQGRKIIPARNNHISKNPKEHEHLDRQAAHSGWRPSHRREGGKTDVKNKRMKIFQKYLWS